MINVSKILYEITENDEVLNPDCNLIDSEILDSFTYIELFSILKEKGIDLVPTRINKDKIKTPKLIQKLVDDFLEEQ